MPMRIFLCAGEPSGDLHGANLVRNLRELDPAIECVGFGGERMAEAGCKLFYPLCRLAVMWFARVLANAHVFLDLLIKADRYFRRCRPDAVVLIDYPGFNWWLARRAHFHGIPVFYFVPPQLWGWAGWRVEKMRRWVDHVLCTLPFEKNWYAERGVQAHYVGHPYFDELPLQEVDDAFIEAERQRPGRVIGLLPGSRTQEIESNFSSIVRAAARIHERFPDCRFLVAAFRSAHREMIADYLRRHGAVPFIEPHVGRTTEIIRLAKACIAVSGSVGLELLYHQKPSVVLYRIGRIDLKVCNYFKKSRFISLVNLLANEELFPEFLTDRCEAAAIAGHMLHWLEDPVAYEATKGRLGELKAKVAEPGACSRTARYIVDTLRAREERAMDWAA
jgi:lipid-A-disaccharide synthase